MRLLLVHNRYGSSAPSGENEVFDAERDLLARNGHDVHVLERRSDELRRRGLFGLLRGAAATPWNPFAAWAIRDAVQAFRPDVVHVHNTFPLLSPSIFPAVGGGAARVLTLHNYRLFCPAALALRAGRPCTECLDRRSVLPALRHGCYRGSRLATVPVAANIAIARASKIWQRHVEAFVALTEFQRDLVVAAGLPADRVFVKPNFCPGRPGVVAWADRRDAAVFVGRLSEEKGIRHLVAAWLSWGPSAPSLRIVGDGPLRHLLEAEVRTRGTDRILFLGQVSPEEAREEIARARLLLLPSVWFEGFPLVLRDAFAFGTPVAVSDLGPLPALVERGRAGLVFRPGDAASLLEAVRAAWADPAGLARRATAARRAYEAEYAEEENHALLVRIYEAALAARRAGVAA